MSIQIPIKTIEDAFTLFSFLKQHNLPFQVDSIEILTAILQNHNLTPYKDILKGSPLESLCMDRTFHTEHVEATSAFKHFCGREWLINGKYITEQIFIERVQQHASIHNLREGFYTRLDSELQEALNTTKPVVNDFELSQLFYNAVNPPVTYFS